MTRFLAIALAASTILGSAALAATSERVRGTVRSVGDGTMVVHTAAGKDVSVMLRDNTKYLEVVKSSLVNVDKDAFIGTAAKEVGGKLIALEVVIFPPAMRGTGEGHYGWDRITDITTAGHGSASSTMTNGTVSAISSQGATANTTMTNGTVASAAGAGGAKTLTVTYKGGQQTILVPPTAPIVAFQPGAIADAVVGKTVFVNASNDDGKLSANAIAVGTNGAKPPM